MHKSLRDLLNEEQHQASRPSKSDSEQPHSSLDIETDSGDSFSGLSLYVNSSQTTIDHDEENETLESISKEFIELDVHSLRGKLPPQVLRKSFEKESCSSLNVECLSQGSLEDDGATSLRAKSPPQVSKLSFKKESCSTLKNVDNDVGSLRFKFPPQVPSLSFKKASSSSLNVERVSQWSLEDAYATQVPRTSFGKESCSLMNVKCVSQGSLEDENVVLKGSMLKSCKSVGEKSLLESLDMVDGEIAVKSGELVLEAWEKIKSAYVYFKGKPVGTLAALDTGIEALNYNQVFVRDFVPSGLACLMKENPEPEIVKNFLLKTMHLPGWEKRIDNFTLGEGVMPASFKILYDHHCQKETLVPDFGGSAIGRVVPVDSGFWWIILLRAYGKCTHDHTLQEHPDVQRGMKSILNLCLSDGFDTFPTLLCADGCSMIDRRMGIYGYPIEIQALFFFALRCARQMIKPEHDTKELIERIDKRIAALSFHLTEYYWLDFEQLNNIYRYKTEEYSHTSVNKFNVIPDSIPDWLLEFMPKRGGYLIGNVSLARMDFRWFLVGNCVAILSSLVTSDQAEAIMDLIEERWDNLIGEMPLKIVYPALEGHDWRSVTGFDPKNTCWSYQNGGSWPVLIWLLTAACIKTGRPMLAKRAIELLEKRLSRDGWPEYYDGKLGRYIGKQARKHQTWTIAGYLVAKLMIENPANIALISMEEDKNIAKPKQTRSSSF